MNISKEDLIQDRQSLDRCKVKKELFSSDNKVVYPIRVGRTKKLKVCNFKNTNNNLNQTRIKSTYYTYMDVEMDEEGWADVKKYIPFDYDLCLLKLNTGKMGCGWWSGSAWDGYAIQDTDEIAFWQKWEQSET